MADGGFDYAVLIEYETRRPRNEWLEVFAPRVTDARRHEPNTLAYSAFANASNPKHVLVFERYVSEEDVKVHINRPAHKTLIDEFTKERMTKRLVLPALKLNPLRIGWWERINNPATSGSVLSVMAIRFQDQNSYEKYLPLLHAHAEYCRKNNPEIIVYSGCLANSSVQKGSYVGMIQKNDLIWITGATSEKAMTRHIEDERHIQLRKDIVKAGIQVKYPFKKIYKSTGLGWMTRKETTSKM